MDMVSEEAENISHTINPGLLANREHWLSGAKSNDSIMRALSDMFASMPLPMSLHDGSVSYDLKTPAILPADDFFPEDTPEELKRLWLKLRPYTPVLNMVYGHSWLDGSSEQAEKILEKLREDRDFTIDLFENALKKQRPDLYTRDTVNIAAAQSVRDQGL
jgi:hypothetical protein